MEEEQTQEQGTQIEQAEPETQPSVAEPSVEELKQTVKELTQEKDRKEVEIKRLHGISKDLQKRGISKTEIDSLAKKIDDMEDRTATFLDDFTTKYGGEYVEPAPIRETYRQKLEEGRKATPQVQSEAPPDVEEFMTYIAGLGFTINHYQVKEAVAEDRSPAEALTYLKEKMDTKTQADIDKQADAKAKILVEQELKDRGLTASGIGTPSASGEDSDNAFMIKYSKSESDDHMRAQKILAKIK